MPGSSEIGAACYRGGQNGGGDPVCGGAERWPPSCVCDVSGSVWPEVLDSVCGQPGHVSHAGPGMAIATRTTKVVATAMALERPSATLNPMETEAMGISPQA